MNSQSKQKQTAQKEEVNPSADSPSANTSSTAVLATALISTARPVEEVFNADKSCAEATPPLVDVAQTGTKTGGK